MVTYSHCQVTSAPTTRSILNIGGIFVYLLWKCVMVNIKKTSNLLSRASTGSRRATWHCGAGTSIHAVPKYSHHNRSALIPHLL